MLLSTAIFALAALHVREPSARTTWAFDDGARPYSSADPRGWLTSAPFIAAMREASRKLGQFARGHGGRGFHLLRRQDGACRKACKLSRLSRLLTIWRNSTMRVHHRKVKFDSPTSSRPVERYFSHSQLFIQADCSRRIVHLNFQIDVLRAPAAKFPKYSPQQCRRDSAPTS